MFDYNYKKPKVIAEIGCNHMGNLDIAKELIQLAKDSGANYVKFQKRNNRELLTEEQYNAPHPVPENSFGSSYGEHRDFLEFSIEQHRELKDYCDSIGIYYSTSVWDCTSAKQIIDLNPKFIKVPSACNNNFDMLEILRDNFSGQVQISLGMTTKDEIEAIVDFFEKKNQSKNKLLIYSCTSGYPVPSMDVCLLELNYLYKKYSNRVQSIGFSGHHIGNEIDVAAYTLGAEWIERHFTKNKQWKGTDHNASLEPKELLQLTSALDNVNLALKFKGSDILPIEEVQREKLKYRIR